MVSREIIPGVIWVGALDFDRRIFDELIPLPSGTSYNAYLIRGSEKTALIDTVDPTKEYDLISNLVKLGIERIDYLVVNHAEQDHAGSIPMVLEFFPDAVVVTNEKCRDMLISLLHLPEGGLVILQHAMVFIRCFCAHKTGAVPQPAARQQIFILGVETRPASA